MHNAFSRLGRLFLLMCILCDFCGAQARAAQEKKPPYAAIVIEHKTGRILHAQNPDTRVHPASLTKIMTLMLLFDALSRKKIRLSTRITVSKRASLQPPSKLGLKAGEKITVNTAMLGLIVKSANDAAVAVAEHLAGSEAAFARQMTEKARKLGLKKTVFKNASGLPDPGQITTAREICQLGRKLYTMHPKFYRFFKVKTLMFRRQTYRSHNRLVGKCDGVDGVKTGYINASGFNLVTSAQRQNVRVFAAVLGGRTGQWRDQRMRQIIDTHFPMALKLCQRAQKKTCREWQSSRFLPPTKPLVLQDQESPELIQPYLLATPQTPTTKRDHGKTLQDLISALNSDEAEEIESACMGRYWGLQFGAFAERSRAETRREKIIDLLPGLHGCVEIRTTRRDGKTLYRVILVNIDEEQSKLVCDKMKSNKIPCLAYENVTIEH